MEKPKRAVELKIMIGGDTDKDVISALEQILFIFDETNKGEVRQITSGAPCAGWITEVVRDPNQTHERYMQSLEAYLNERPK